MKKSLLNWSLVAMLLCSMSLTFTACSDDDDENKSEQRSNMDPLDTDETRVAWRWINQLTDETELSEGWQSKTYDVTAGEPSSANELVRLIVVDDVERARQSFSLLADCDPSELTAKRTVNGGAAGTMTWTPSAANAKNLAEVTVNSRLFPKLQKIVYCTAAQKGDNGLLWDSMKGTAYYRFGDVICDPDGYYWLCVRPSFQPDNKKSHWVNIFNASETGNNKAIPAENLYTKYNKVDKYGQQTIILPTRLSYNREKTRDLANLIWALLDVDAYRNVCLKNPKAALGGFDYEYHGEKFLKAVGGYWNRKDSKGYTVWERLFNCTREDMLKMKELAFIYQGYSWVWGSTGHIWRYKSTAYEPTYSGSESADKEEYDFAGRGFDVTNFAGTPMSVEVPFAQFRDVQGGTSGTWVIRHKTGAELMTGGTYSPYRNITSNKGYMTEVYCYNTLKDIDPGEEIEPETESHFKLPENDDVIVTPGTIIGADLRFYDNVSDATGAGTTPMAIVVYMKDLNSVYPVEYGLEYDGLAMALTDIEEQEWAVESSFGMCCSRDTENDFLTYLDGMKWTGTMSYGCGGSRHSHPAAVACRKYAPKGYDDDRRRDLGFSDWFMPSAGQWLLALTSMGVTWNNRNGSFTEVVRGQGYNTLYSKFSRTGAEQYCPSGVYWTCTDRDDDTAVFLKLNENTPLAFSGEWDEEALKTMKYKSRPFIAFQTLR